MMKSLLFAAVIYAFCSIGIAAASTITVDYTGVVAYVNNIKLISGYTVGESITGRMTLTLPDTPQRSYAGGVPVFDAYHGTGSSTINGNQISGSGSVTNRSSSFGQLSFGITDTSGGMYITNDLYFDGSPAPLLGSLKNLPTTLAAIQDYLGNPLTASRGYIDYNAPGVHLWDINWNVASLSISPVSETPIPASLPLLVSALCGLGLQQAAARRAKRKLKSWNTDLLHLKRT